MQLKSKLFIISGPSGVGKGTIVSEILKDSSLNLKYSISATSRLPRVGEQEGISYFYKTKEEFEQMIKNNELIEFVKYGPNYYGTPKSFIDEQLKNNKNVLLEIEVIGAKKVIDENPEVIGIFIAPPSFEELEKRLIKRGTETKEAIHSRLEIARDELENQHLYKYVVLNDDLQKAITKVKEIIRSENE